MTNREKIQELQKTVGTNPDGKMHLDPPGETLRAIQAVAKADPDAEWGAKPKPVDGPTDSEKVDDRSEGNIATLHPKVQEDFRILCRKANEAIAPKVWKWTCGTRTYAEQAKLHDAYVNHGGPQATSPGNSAHNFSIACDGTVFASDGHTPIWDDPEYTTVGKLGRSLGFHWGADFGDEPHFCKRPPNMEHMTESEMMAELRRRHAAGIDAFA